MSKFTKMYQLTQLLVIVVWVTSFTVAPSNVLPVFQMQKPTTGRLNSSPKTHRWNAMSRLKPHIFPTFDGNDDFLDVLDENTDEDEDECLSPHDLNAISMKDLKALSNVSTIEEYLALFCLELPSPEDQVEDGIQQRLEGHSPSEDLWDDAKPFPLIRYGNYNERHDGNNRKNDRHYEGIAKHNGPSSSIKVLTTASQVMNDASGSEWQVSQSENSIKMAKTAVCKPSVQVVELTLPVTQDVTFFPTCVRLHRCGGCCNTDLFQCQPNTTQMVTLGVAVIPQISTHHPYSLLSGERQIRAVAAESSSSSSSNSRNSRRNRIKGKQGRQPRGGKSSIQTVQVEEHTSCECACRVKESQCRHHDQEYDGDNCRCVCSNKQAEETCLAKRNHYWDSKACLCLCIFFLKCSSDEYFNEDSCTCVEDSEVRKFPFTDENYDFDRIFLRNFQT